MYLIYCSIADQLFVVGKLDRRRWMFSHGIIFTQVKGQYSELSRAEISDGWNINEALLRITNLTSVSGMKPGVGIYAYL
jgi:hypothetical protein